MNRREACLMLGAALPLAACSRRRQPARHALLVSGADAMLPLLQALMRAFQRERPALDVIVERGGSLPAYIAASRRAIDVAAMARVLSDAEDGPGARHYLIARSDIRIIAHPDLAVTNLTRAQVRGLLAGDIINWRTLGGPDLPVIVHAHPRNTAPRQSTEQLLLDGSEFAPEAREAPDDAALAAAVAAQPGAIAYQAGHARSGQELAAVLPVDGVTASTATVLSGRYPYTQGFHLLLHGAAGGEREAFVHFARSAAGQAIVASLGLIAVC
ncbi:hypothetical protein GTP58_08105 [Duganella sp. CY15W]|uniref:substrate-binding domain-containing protein n=1 Tax=Duganella sp. CY15W TaxID=2692172 RepID=UPI00136ACD7E|nr:hypothetical protein [Duganella sp. CY15W]